MPDFTALTNVPSFWSPAEAAIAKNACDHHYVTRNLIAFQLPDSLSNACRGDNLSRAGNICYFVTHPAEMWNCSFQVDSSDKHEVKSVSRGLVRHGDGEQLSGCWF